MGADPSGYRVTGVFTALPAAGIIFSYLGFRTAIDLGGESANPGRNIPLAVIGSAVLAAILYILLQAPFLYALAPADLAHGWAHLSYTGQMGPFAGLAATLGLGWMATLLYIDAYVSPGGTGLMYVTGGSRILFAVGEMGAGPHALMKLNVNQVPWMAVLVMWVVGAIFLLPFPAWQQMVNYITSITVLTYGLGPVALLVLRHSMPDIRRPFRLRGAWILRLRPSSAATGSSTGRASGPIRSCLRSSPSASSCTHCTIMSWRKNLSESLAGSTSPGCCRGSAACG